MATAGTTEQEQWTLLSLPRVGKMYGEIWFMLWVGSPDKRQTARRVMDAGWPS